MPFLFENNCFTSYQYLDPSDTYIDYNVNILLEERLYSVSNYNIEKKIYARNFFFIVPKQIMLNKLIN